ncbi:MAG: MBL fold metallo-hydrolase [Promethearchaeota archaeon]
MTRIAFLGSCREVGRAGILITSNNGRKFILDYGIGFQGKERLPLPVDVKNLKGVALTHAHIDHSGALPKLYKEKQVPLYTNPISLRISEILIKDLLNISKYNFQFGYRELEKLRNNACFLEEGIRQKIDENFYITFINAGHIPGSVSILIEVDGKNILYSGDINTQSTNLCFPTHIDHLPPIDCLIIESTYALKTHPNREMLEKTFVDKISNLISNGGRVLIPAFAVARSQEVLLILHKYNYYDQIYVDGLSRKICTIYLNYPEALKDYKIYKKVLKKIKFVSRQVDRVSIKKKNAVFIVSSGMLKGGAVMEYLKTILRDPLSAIYIVGYQVENSPGRTLLDKGYFNFKRDHGRSVEDISQIKVEAKCEYEYFDFSSHADGSQLLDYVNGLKFRDGSQVFCIHGDEKSTTSFSSLLVKKGYNSVAPEIGEEYVI